MGPWQDYKTMIALMQKRHHLQKSCPLVHVSFLKHLSVTLTNPLRS